MLVTPWGSTTRVKPVQPSKAEPPISVTLPGMVTLVRTVQPWNAPLQMLVTPLSITTDWMYS